MRTGPWWLLAVLICLLVAPARAQRQPSESDRATARALMDQGDKHFAQGKYEAALKSYKAADDIMQVPTTGVELGRAQIKVGQLVEASNTLLRVTRFPQQPNEPRAFVEAREEARQLSATLPSRIPSVTLAIEGLHVSDKALVKIDGQPVPPATLGLPRQINPGDHVVSAVARGYKPAERRFSIAEGASETVTLGMVPESAEEDATPTPAQDKGDNGVSISPLTWVGLSVGVALLVVGTATGVVALNKGSSLQEECEAQGAPEVCDPDLQDDIDNAKLIAHVSTASFAIGGAALVVGIVSLAIDLTSASEAPATSQLVVGPGSIGLRIVTP